MGDELKHISEFESSIISNKCIPQNRLNESKDNMKYYLYTFEKDWADEFDCSGWEIHSESEHNANQLLIKQYGDFPVSYEFGTNEGWEDIPLSEMWESYTVTEITSADRDVILKSFDSAMEYGSFAVIPSICNFAWDIAQQVEGKDDDFGPELKEAFLSI
jgi:hypothetical protein